MFIIKWGDNMDKKHKIILMILGIALGYAAGFGGGKLLRYLFPDKKASFLIIGLIIVLVLFFSIAIHEMGHFIGFKYNKIPVRMLNIYILSLIFDGSKWNLKFNHNGGNVGGIVVPNLKPVNSHKEFKENQKANARAILGGPIASLLLVILGNFLLAKDGYIAVIGLSLIGINVATLLTCFIKTENVYADFPAYKAYKKDDFFVALMLYQYAAFAVDYKDVIENNGYLRDLLLEGLLPRINNRQLDLFTVSCVTTFIEGYLAGIIDEMPEDIRNYIDYYYNNYQPILEEAEQEANKQLLLYISYFYKKEENLDKATEIYHNFTFKLPKSEIFDYWKIQSQQLILGKDNSHYLLNKHNIKPNSNYNIFKKLEGFYYYDLIINQKF